MATRLVFGDASRKRLLELGLFEAQILRLESHLYLCKTMVSAPAAMADVRTLLTDLAKPLRAAKKKLECIVTGSSKAPKEAALRIEMSGYTPLTDIDPLPEARAALDWFTKAVDDALAALPKAQRHVDDASPFPIGIIERDLLQGFVEHHQSNGPLPKYSINTSRTQQPFPEIAAIFYEAIGRGEPDRAIRKHLALKKRTRSPRHLDGVVRYQATEGIVKVEADQ